uniref:Uncharacterized protein n=1 Tax=Nelumbo nucifera TaxID=4432 RepID=A0A822YW12_NELNU|nr:TPA_asm: hypothetical protein HUJ06_007513 [Nelumbo nucifera]
MLTCQHEFDEPDSMTGDSRTNKGPLEVSMSSDHLHGRQPLNP